MHASTLLNNPDAYNMPLWLPGFRLGGTSPLYNFVNFRFFFEKFLDYVYVLYYSLHLILRRIQIRSQNKQGVTIKNIDFFVFNLGINQV